MILAPMDWSWLSPGYWLSDATEPLDGTLAIVLGVMLTLGMAAGLYLRLSSGTMFGGHRFKQRQARGLANPAIGLCAAGLVILLFRWQLVPLLSNRIWLMLWWLAVLGGTGYVVWFYRRRYPARLAAYEQDERRRRYLPRAAVVPARARRKPRRKR